MNYEASFAKLIDALRRALDATTIEESRIVITDAVQQAERIAKAVVIAPIKRGRKGGTKTAERGPDYFRQIAAMRKTRAGGRPKKSTQKNP